MTSLPPLLLSAEDVCQRLAISRVTLWRLCKLGKFPPAVELGALKRWRTVDIEAFVDSGGTRSGERQP